MLKEDKPDGVVIGLPNQFHFKAGMELIQHGVPMLVEKPVCDSVEEAIFFADAEQANVPVLVGHHRRHSPLTQRAKSIIDSGRLDRITAVQGFCRSKTFAGHRRQLGRVMATRVQPAGNSHAPETDTPPSIALRRSARYEKCHSRRIIRIFPGKPEWRS
jgi:hypothetical protein